MSPFLKATMPRLNTKIIKLHENVGQPQGSLSSRVGLQADEEIADPTKAAPHRNPVSIYATVAVSRSAHTSSPSKEFADRGITLDAAQAAPSPNVSTVEED
jgi:hypothetical protein